MPEKPTVTVNVLNAEPMKRLIDACRKLRDEDAMPPLVVNAEQANRIYLERLERNLNAVYLALDGIEAATRAMSEGEGTVRS